MQTGENELVSLFSARLMVMRPLPCTDSYALRDMIIDMTTMKNNRDSSAIYLFIDLSPLSVIPSLFIGALGATVQLPEVRNVTLCGMKPAVQTIVERMGIEDSGLFINESKTDLLDTKQKFRIFNSVEAALAEFALHAGEKR